MTFEEILCHISDSPSKVLQNPFSDKTVYQILKEEFNDVPISFYLDRLTNEFEKMHNAVI